MRNTTPSNLLILISDEHRRDAMGCMGHPLVKTPNLDALAARGTVFERAYTPSPMCVPTRASLATGRPVHQTGHWDSATAYAGAPRSWMHDLRDAGVDVTSIGKLHFRSRDDDTGFSAQILPMHVVGGVGWAIGLLRKNPPPYDVAAELAQDVGAGDSSYTRYDLDITAATEAWLSAPERQDKPWAAFVSLVSPHYPLTAPQDYYDLYDPADMDLPVGHAPEYRPQHPELQQVAQFFDYDAHFDAQRIRQAKAAYYGLVSFMDACVGRVLAALERSGQADNTLILYVSDHGDMMGDLGFWTKQVMYEASAGVPMILAGPGVPQGARRKTATNLFDVAPTALEIFGLSPQQDAPPLFGSSLVALAQAPDDLDRATFSEYHDGGSSTGTFMLRWNRWKYVHYVGYTPQLFDLDADPHELRDLVAAADQRPDVVAALAEGEARLRAICDPEAVDQRCFADQAAKIEALGGRDACVNAYVFNHTPTPGEQDAREGSAL